MARRTPPHVQTWEQLGMIPPARVRVELTCVLDGTRGTCHIGLGAWEDDTDVTLLLEAATAVDLPSALPAALERLSQVLQHYVDQLLPF